MGTKNTATKLWHHAGNSRIARARWRRLHVVNFNVVPAVTEVVVAPEASTVVHSRGTRDEHELFTCLRTSQSAANITRRGRGSHPRRRWGRAAHLVVPVRRRPSRPPSSRRRIWLRPGV